MSEDKKKKGFSGLSSLVSYIDETEAVQVGRKDQTQNPGNIQQQDRRPKDPSDLKTESKQASQLQSGQRVVDSSTIRPPGSGSWTPLLLMGLIGVGILIWLVYVAQWDGRSSRTVPSYTSPSASQSYALSTTPDRKTSSMEYSMPPIGDNNVLSVAQIRWCLREQIHIKVLRPKVTTNAKIDQFNAIVTNYNNRCASFRYREGVLTRARREVDGVRAQIVADVPLPW